MMPTSDKGIFGSTGVKYYKIIFPSVKILRNIELLFVTFLPFFRSHQGSIQGYNLSKSRIRLAASAFPLVVEATLKLKVQAKKFVPPSLGQCNLEVPPRPLS